MLVVDLYKGLEILLLHKVRALFSSARGLNQLFPCIL